MKPYKNRPKIIKGNGGIKTSDVVATFGLPEVNVYPNNKWGDIARSQGLETARNWRKVKEGTTKGINDFANDPRTQFVSMVLPLPQGLEYAGETLKMINKGINNSKRHIISKVIDSLPIKPISKSDIPETTLVSNRIGDVEIVPYNNYRQGTIGMVDDFFDTGIVRTKDNPNRKIRTVGRFNFSKETFPNPMFAKGNLWYGVPEKSDNRIDLLVTSEPLQFANKYAKASKFDDGIRRIPFNIDQLNTRNTSAYRYYPEYGYKRLAGKTYDFMLNFNK